MEGYSMVEIFGVWEKGNRSVKRCLIAGNSFIIYSGGHIHGKT